jgi:hypothetical protein
VRDDLTLWERHQAEFLLETTVREGTLLAASRKLGLTRSTGSRLWRRLGLDGDLLIRRGQKAVPLPEKAPLPVPRGGGEEHFPSGLLTEEGLAAFVDQAGPEEQPKEWVGYATEGLEGFGRE